METYRGVSFADARIALDGSQYINCTFERCVLVYAGVDAVGMEGCNLSESEWEFTGSAANTLAFWRSLYRGFGDEGPLLLKSVWQQIEAP